MQVASFGSAQHDELNSLQFLLHPEDVRRKKNLPPSGFGSRVAQTFRQWLGECVRDPIVVP